MKHIFVFLGLVWAVRAFAVDATQEYVCTTAAGQSSFYADIGRTVCNDQATDLDQTHSILCNFAAKCVPADQATKDAIVHEAGKPWDQLSDDDRNHFLSVAYYDHHSVQLPTPDDMSVQCLGTKLSNGDPSCGHVNDCVNNRRMSAIMWKPQSYRAFNTTDSLQGAGLRKNGRSVQGSVR